MFESIRPLRRQNFRHPDVVEAELDAREAYQPNETVPSIDDAVGDSTSEEPDMLRGNPFYMDILHITDPKDLAYPNSYERRCAICLFRTGMSNHDRDCRIIIKVPGKSPHEMFNIPVDERLPENLDGKEVGHYCPYWRHEDSE